jgi:hypothetical protein
MEIGKSAPRYRRGVPMWEKESWRRVLNETSTEVGKELEDWSEHLNNVIDAIRSLKQMQRPDETGSMVIFRMVCLFREMQFKKWIGHLITEPRVWKGRETAIFVENDGEAMTPDFVDRALRAAAVAAKLGKPVSSHVLRKSVGTLIGRENPKFAA